MKLHRTTLVGALSLVVLACGGSDEREDPTSTAGPSGGEGAGGAATGGGTSGGAGGMGLGGAGGVAGGGGCTPGEVVPCYDGPGGTEGVGICAAGTATCASDGSDFGACEDQVLPATEICSAPDDEDCDGVASACTGAQVWETLVTSSANSTQSIGGVAVSPTGVYVTGALGGLADLAGTVLDPGGDDGIFVAKLDLAGTPLWSKAVTSTGAITSIGIVVDDQERVTVAGSFQDDVDAGMGAVQGVGNWDVFVAGFEGGDGSLRYLDTYGTSTWQVVRGIAARPDGQVAITGNFYGTVNFGGNQLSATGGGTAQDMFVAVFDSQGAHQWSKQFGDDTFQGGHRVAFAPGGDLLVSGYAAGTIDFGGMPHISAGIHDMVVAKLDAANGSRIWSAMYGDAASQSGIHSVAVGPDGAVFVTNYSSSIDLATIDFGTGPLTGHFFLVKHDVTGNVLWAKAYGGLRGPSNLVVDPAGDVVLAGSIQGTIDFGDGPVSSFGNSYDAFVVKLSGAAGDHLWTHVFGDTNQQDTLQRAFAVATDVTGGIYAGGSWHGATDFGFGEHISDGGVGGPDGWLVHFDP